MKNVTFKILLGRSSGKKVAENVKLFGCKKNHFSNKRHSLKKYWI